MDMKFDIDNWFSNFIKKLKLPDEEKNRLIIEYSQLKNKDGTNLSDEEFKSFLKELIGGYRGMIYEPKEFDCIAKWSDRKLKNGKLITNLSVLADPISIPEPSVDTEMQSELEKFIQQKPYNILVLGQGGVGKRTAVKALFGLSDYSKGFAKEETSVAIDSINPIEGVEFIIYDNNTTDINEYFLNASMRLRS